MTNTTPNYEAFANEVIEILMRPGISYRTMVSQIVKAVKHHNIASPATQTEIDGLDREIDS